MWSLPDIRRLNTEAASATERKTILKAVHQQLDALGNPIHCDYCGSEAEDVSPCFDIFSDDAKGGVALCQEHINPFGSIPEGYFWGDERLMGVPGQEFALTMRALPREVAPSPRRGTG